MIHSLNRVSALLVAIVVTVATITAFSGAAVAQDRDSRERDGPIDDAFDYVAHTIDPLGWHNDRGDHSHGDHWNDHHTEARHGGHGPQHPDDERPHSGSN